VQQNRLKPGEFLVGVMYYIQLTSPVRTFPPSNDPAWELFINYLANEPGLGISISPNLNIESLLDDVTMIDMETNRIFIDPRDAPRIVLDGRFRRVAQRIYKIALETRGLIEFS
jgi:hypothetical protein